MKPKLFLLLLNLALLAAWLGRYGLDQAGSWPDGL
jgi:hypothetical protein